CATPVRLSTHTGWNTPSAPTAMPEVCPASLKKFPSEIPNESVFDTLPWALTGHCVAPVYALGASDTTTLGENVSPPSSDAAARMRQPMLSPASRRSYQTTSTAPFA